MSWLAVGGTAASAAISVGGGLLSQSMSKGSGGQLPAWKDVANVSYDPAAGARDFASILPSLTQSANAITKNQTKQREKIMPGSAAQFRQGSGVIQDWLKGEVPQDVVDFTNRQVAERAGGSWNPWSQGGQAGSDFSRSIGKLSSDFTTMGIQASPQWQQLANSFVTNPLQVAPFASQMANQRYQYDALNSSIDIENASSGWSSAAQGTMYGDQFAQQEGAQMNQMLGGLAGALQTGVGIYGQGGMGAGGAGGMPAMKPTGYMGVNNQMMGLESGIKPRNQGWTPYANSPIVGGADPYRLGSRT